MLDKVIKNVVLLDPKETFVVQATESESQQGYTPLEGQKITGKVKSTFLRGQLIYDQGQITGAPQGKYIKRPMAHPTVG